MMIERRCDILAICFLLVSHAILGILFLFRTETICFSDCVTEYSLKLAAFARQIQTGALPLADLNTFAGAKSHYFSSIWLYYPLVLPLYWLADPENLGQVAATLIVAPFAFHLLLAALGTYVFSRSCLKISPLAALGAAWAYTFSSSMLTLDYLNQVSALSYLPWVSLATAHLVELGSARAWIAGATLLGLMNVASNPTLTIRISFLIGLQALCLALASRSSWGQAMRRLLAVTAMGVVGLGLAAYAWAGVYNGLMWVQSAELGTCQKVMDFSSGSSLSPVSLWSLLFPFAFIRQGGEMFLGGGFVLLQLVGLGALSVFGARGANRREWPVIGLILFVLGLLIVLGKHTSVYNLLCQSIPGLFSFPHPVAWGLMVAWGAAILAGVGLQRLCSQPSRAVSSSLLAFGCAAALYAVLNRPAIREFRWEDALVAPEWYVGIAAIFCLIGVLSPARRRAQVLTAALLAECLLTPVSLLVQTPAPATIDPWAFPLYTLQNDAFRELRPVLKDILSRQSARFAGVHAYIDNQAWAVDGRSLFGYQPVALYPRFLEASKRVAVGHPYSLRLISTPRFLPNMNVRWIVSYKLREEGADPPWFDRATYLAQVQPLLDVLPVVAHTQHFEIRELSSSLPYAYAQDRIVSASETEQLAHLLDSDLRQAVYVDANAGVTIGDFDAREDAVAHFEQMQRVNRVRKAHAGGNRIQLDVDFEKPAMLVIAETAHPGWEATVDGEGARLLQVNYLQEGLWVERGAHRIVLEFRPLAARIGRAISLLSLGLVLLVFWRDRRASMQ